MNKQKKISFKTIIAAILALALVFCTFSACSGKSSDGKDSDSKDLSETAKSEEKKADISFADKNTGDIIKFGTYEQDNDTSNGKEEIEWIVLAKEDNRMLVVSKYALDSQLYNTDEEEVTWETCTLRQWLNDSFINEAFNSEEQNRIQTTDVVNNDNSEYETSGGNDTKDKVFLLSTEEAEKYFDSYEARLCAPTVYAKKDGMWTKSDGSCVWWLRSPGNDTDHACSISGYGTVDVNGYYVYTCHGGIRPALWINL